MAELTISRTFWISETHPQVTLRMTFRIELPGPRWHSISIGKPPNIPDHLLVALWDRGISDGVHAAILDVNFPLSTSDVEIDIRDLSISESIDTFTEEEIEHLRQILLAISREAVQELFTMITPPADC